MRIVTLRLALATLVVLLWVTTKGSAQVNSGSTGSDGALNVSVSTNIDMANHPTGIYNYTSVNISGGTVTFTPNANNTPVVWLVQSSCVINGQLDVSGQNGGYSPAIGGVGGPGGWQGGSGYPSVTSGQGLGGGIGSMNGGNASYGTLGSGPCSNMWSQTPGPGPSYGNAFLVPLLGGSGGGGSSWVSGGGGGGGGAILIAASGTLTLNGEIKATGGNSSQNYNATPQQWGGGGSGGGVRFVASKIAGTGSISAYGGGSWAGGGGSGRVRFDTYESDFGGSVTPGNVFTQGSQFIILPTPGQLPQLTVTSVGGVPVSASPTGALSTPDAVLSAQQNNPIPIVVSCANLPLHSLITVSVAPMNGSPVSATGYNDSGTAASSTCTILINMPRGGGLITATAATAP